jgi:propionyl-CoA synthetase
VVGITDAIKGQVPIAFVVLRDLRLLDAAGARETLEAELARSVDRQLGAIGRPAKVYFLSMLPKTRSGKLLRRAIAALAEGKEAGELPTIEDVGALAQVRDALGL